MKLFPLTLGKIALALSLLCIGSVTQVSCQTQTKKEHKSSPHIMEIDAAYMKQNIFDYEKNPTKFVYKGDKPAIIDFYANWCGPCRQLAPKLEKLVDELNGEVLLYKVNVDNNRDLAYQFNVESIPMVIFIPKEGRPYQTMGNLPEETIKEYIEKIRTKE